MTKRKRNLWNCILTVLLCVVFLCGCGDTTVVLTTGFGKEDVFVIGGQVCSRAEMMVYLTNVQNQYENVYGSEIWDASLDGVTLEENVKETVLARIAQVKTMYLLAQNKEVALTAEEEALTQKAAEEYYDSLTLKEIELLQVDVPMLTEMYRQYALADKVFYDLTADINPEISDDEARTVKVEHIYFATCIKNGAGNTIYYSDEEKAKVLERAMEVLTLSKEEGSDFLSLAEEYSDEDIYTISFGKGEMDEGIERSAFSLKTGEISNIIETENGYHLLKCISTLDREETDANKILIVEERKRKTFEEEYDAFVDTLIRNLNEELWDEMGLLHEEEVTTSAFFAVYEELFRDHF